MTVRWGIAGPGGIAVAFAEAMNLVEDGVITAVASRSKDRAEAFALRYGIASAYGDYTALAEDSQVDAVYVATPHSRHLPDTLLYANAGKHVLCEKPFALSSAQAETMARAASDNGVFVMEAMWSRFLPAYRTLKEVLAGGEIGEPLLVEADFGFRVPVNPGHRLFDPVLGGGALLDLGIYPLQLCSLVFGNPDNVVAAGRLGATGVDEHVAAVLHHPDGGLGVVKAAIRVSMTCTARIAGTDGSIDLPAFMHCPDHIIVNGADGPNRIDRPFASSGFQFEIMEVHRGIERAQTESEEMPLRESVALARTMDGIRAQLGLRYPGE
jgi:predicted dehydrogenase